ncbi:DUF4247 domain-containing protein [Halanaerobacter jeridensis]|uniref:Na+-transporting methylmalonyl-CoA/oxaloacetate decarboxylase gamma subunit n=1 Tax=Halanaerobacter jeridensis TaxID=706427 RepID=A0A938XRY7_9FIRM|nr:DUF4247 domain-containing protein [Halanaerobacter jeridensis]MBM7556694.1 Na+-transporting methylmalonyl-CoA/oxaloacetate decarboxylase gamma subunit [Halanaerobacter jeridensis]
MKFFNQEISVFLFLLIIVPIIIGCSYVVFSYNDIEDEIEDNFTLKEKINDDVKIFKSKQDVDKTVDEITTLVKPYDQADEPSGKTVLLYQDEVVIVKPSPDGNSLIEVCEHDDAHRRHTNIITTHWGSRMRNGNIGNPPSRSGGFGFGK